MNLENIEKCLNEHLMILLPHHAAKESYFYAVLPGGKLFRPSLVWSLLNDCDPELYQSSIKNKFSPHALLASAVEFHHSYSLVHDDLPSMDNDQIRRGKPCTHMKFGEWQAILTGDGLLNLSYQILLKSKHPRTLDALRFFTWAVGPKGLIHGQVLDLSQEMNLSLDNLMLTHELKTARLIQASIVCSAILTSKINTKMEKNLFRYSKLLGVNFQLLDDLTELVEDNLTGHEIDVNPWFKKPNETLKITLNNLEKFNQLSNELKLIHTDKIVADYYEKMTKKINVGLKNIKKHTGQLDILPVMLVLKNFRSI